MNGIDEISDQIDVLQQMVNSEGWKIIQTCFIALAETYGDHALQTLDARPAGRHDAYTHAAILPLQHIARLQKALEDAKKAATMQSSVEDENARPSDDRFPFEAVYGDDD